MSNYKPSTLQSISIPDSCFSLCLVASIGLWLTGCGESDLKELQEDEIHAAQQAVELQPDSSDGPSGGGGDQTPETPPETPPGQANPGSETPDPEEPVDTGTPTEVETLLSGYTMVFSDEFNGATLNQSKWNTQFQWGPDLIVNDEEQYYVDAAASPDFGYNPFVFDGESLIITAQRTPGDLATAANDQPYLSGVLTSLGLFDLTYGYVEIRAKLPAGQGYWPGFWMLGSEFIDRKPQLFIMENRGDNAGVVYHRYNYSDSNDEFVFSDLLQSTAQNFSDEFHTFGVEWSEGSLTYYVDGQSQHTIAHGNVSSQAMYIILNLAVGGWFPEAPDNTTTFPGEFTIDYVRAYQRN